MYSKKIKLYEKINKIINEIVFGDRGKKQDLEALKFDILCKLLYNYIVAKHLS